MLFRLPCPYPGAPLAGGFTPIGCESSGTVTFDDPGVATIRGRKFGDANGNGIEDNDEIGLEGWTIQIYDDQGEFVDEVITDPSGEYEFIDLDGGTYTIVEVAQAGWVQTHPAGGSHVLTIDGGQAAIDKNFGNFELASVHGFKWNDLDSDGIHDEGEPGLANVLVWADADGDGVWDVGTETATLTTADDPTTPDVDETGEYSLLNMMPGDYTIREIVPAGYVRTYPVRHVLNLDRFESVDVHRGWSSDNPLTPGALDIDRAPASNRGFLGTFGDEIVTLELEDLPAHTLLNISFDLFVLGSWNGNAGGPQGPDRWQFRADGNTLVNTSFSNTATNQAYPGTWPIGNNPARSGAEENDTLGYDLTGEPPSGPPPNPADSVYHFSFGIPHAASTLTLDFEAILAGAGVDFEKWGLDNVVVSFPISGHDVSLGSGDSIEDINFGNHAQPGEIHGNKFIDANGNGVKDTNERGLGGVTIYLDLNNDGTFDTGEPFTKTALPGDFDGDGIVGLADLGIMASHFGQCNVGVAQGDINGDGCVNRADAAAFARVYANLPPMGNVVAGEYWFTDLAPGSYTVREIVPPGYIQTAPAGGQHVVDLAPAQVITGLNFGNVRPGEITGIKYFDKNGNGVQDPGEPGIAGVTIYADLNNNSKLDPGEPSTVTLSDDPNTQVNETGVYVLVNVPPGVRTIREVVPDGCRQTGPQGGTHVVTVAPGRTIRGRDFGNLCEGNIDGTKWADTDADRLRDPGEKGVAGVTVYVDVNNNKRLDAGEPSTVTMSDSTATPWDDTGMYSLQRVPMGTHVVREVVPAGATQTWPIGGAHVVTLTAGQTSTGNDFGNAGGGEICGVKWNDVNRNGQRDTVGGVSEPGVPGVTIYLDLDNDGQYDQGEPIAVTTNDNPQPGDQAGEFCFKDVPPGTYIVREVLQPGWIQTTPPNNGGVTVVVTPGSTVTGVRFGNVRDDTGGTVTGTKYEDVNGNGQRDGAGANMEPGVPDVTIYADMNDNASLDQGEPSTVTTHDNQSTQPDERGHYTLFLPSGTPVRIREVLPAGYGQSAPANNGAHTVTVPPGGNVTGRDFGNYKFGEIHGTKWNDANGNRILDVGPEGTPLEGCIPGVTIYIDLNDDGQFQTTEPSTVTMADIPGTPENECGTYSFTNLPPGMYRVREVVPVGMVQTFPVVTNPHNVNLISGQIKTGIDFGNRPVQQPIEFTDFADAANRVRFNANAAISQNRLRLTPNASNQRGSAYLMQPVQFTGDFSFQTHFVFQISAPLGVAPGDVDGIGGQGLTFVMHNSPAGATAIGTGGGGMGLAGIANAIAVEFDTFHTGAFDPAANLNTNGSHIGIDVSSLPESIAQTGPLPRFNDNASGARHVWIEYDGFANVMEVYFSTTMTKPSSPSLTTTINLTGSTSLFVGFTAATDTQRNHHDILSWEMTVGAAPPSPGAGEEETGVPTFDFGAGAASPPAPAAAPDPSDVLIPSMSNWKYLDNGSNQGAVWRAPAFNDAAWPTGPAQFGYSEGDEATILAQQGQNGPVITSYFRKHFNVQLIEDVNQACLGLLRDDGAIVYLNGTEVVRTNMPAGAVGFQTLATGPATDDGQKFNMFAIPAGAFVQGDNVLAVELHQASAPLINPEDASFDAFLFAEPCGGNIHGVKWRDTDGDGVRDQGEPGIAGVTIWVDVNDNGVLNPAIDRVAVTMADDPTTPADETGHYWLENVPAGSHTVREVVPAGYTQSYPVNPPHHTVGLETNQTLAGLNFGNRPNQTQTGEVTGTKYFDLDGDGLRDQGEGGIPNVTVYADLNNNGQLDGGEPSTQTQQDDQQTQEFDPGKYRLTNLPPTTVVIREVIPQGFIQTAPQGGAWTVPVTPGSVTTGKDFGNTTQGESGRAFGHKWNDLDGDGKWDQNETGMGGVVIFADMDGDGIHDPNEPSTVTEPDGSYDLFLPLGQIAICEVVPDNYVQTHPVNPNCHPFFVQPGMTVEGFNFGNHRDNNRPGQIHGMKWDDYKNALGSHDPDEPGVGGITIYLDINQNGVFDAGDMSTVTGPDGKYSFMNVPPGTYHVREVLPEGYAQTFPAPPNTHHVVVVGGGQVVTGVDFGNFEYIIIPDGADEIYGAANNDRLKGDNEVSDPRTLSFGDDDTIFGDNGQDTLDGQDEDDELWGGAGADHITGGVDPTERDRVLQEVNANQVLNNGLLTGQGPDTLVDIEHGTLIGGASANSIDARPFTRGSVILIGMGGNDSLYGTAFDDELFGGDDDATLAGDGNDSMEGGAGNDSLTGDEGNDTAIGGFGDDTYLFRAALAIQTDTVDEEGVAAGGIDTVDFTSLSAGVPVTFNLTTGTGSHANRTFSIVDKDFFEVLLGGAGNDVFTGSALANNRLVGNAGNDTLSGVGGTNTITGGEGNDTITGGSGADTFVYGPDWDVDTLSDSGGAGDVLDMTAVTGDIVATINVGSLAIAEGANSIAVSSNNIESILSGSGDDLFNFASTATLAAGTGSIDANDGTDEINYTPYTSAVTINFTTSTSTGTGGIFDFEDATGGTVGDTITGSGAANVLVGLGGPDIISGIGGADHLIGNAGADLLDGGADDDTLEGGAGNDVLTGGANNDLFLFIAPVGSETDTITEATSPAGGVDTADFTFLATALTANLPANVMTHASRTVNLTNPTSLEVVLSGSGNDSLTGDGGNNVFVSGVGNDTLVAGGGDDSLTGGPDNDTYRIALAAAGDSVVVDEQPSGGTDTLSFSPMAAGDFAVVNIGVDGVDDTPGLLARHGTDLLRTVTILDPDNAINFENLLGSAGNDVMTGSVIDNSIDGAAGHDELHGGDGEDTLTGATGNDSLYGGKHEDRLIGGVGTNRLDGGTHHDTYVFTQGSGASDTLREDPSQVISGLTVIGGQDVLEFGAFTIPITVNLSSVAAQAVATGLLATLQRVNGSANSDHFENVSGSATAANNLTGNIGDNSLTGGSAGDTLTGGDGEDTLTGNAGNDRLLGQNHDDLLIHDAADVTSVQGGAGADTLRFVGAGSLNLATATHITGIDIIDLGNFGASVSGTPTAITGRTDSGTLLVNGNSGSVTLTGGWNLLVNGSTTNTYQDLALTRLVVVDDDLSTAASSPPAPAAVVARAKDRAIAAFEPDSSDQVALAVRPNRAAARARVEAIDRALDDSSQMPAQSTATTLRATRAIRARRANILDN